MTPSTGAIRPLLLTTGLTLALLLSPIVHSVSASETSFMPTWRLLSQEQKQTFVAGYLHGWRDARRVAEIVGEHLERNPDQVHKSMQAMQGIYDLSELRPEQIVREIDQFYQEPENARAPLSKAISSSRRR